MEGHPDGGWVHKFMEDLVQIDPLTTRGSLWGGEGMVAFCLTLVAVIECTSHFDPLVCL